MSCFLLPCFLVILLVCQQIAFAEMHSYKDEDGNLHVVGSASEIPKRYRKKTKTSSAEAAASKVASKASSSKASFLEKISAKGEEILGSLGVDTELQKIIKKIKSLLAKSSDHRALQSYIKNVADPYIEKQLKLNKGSKKKKRLKRKLLKDLKTITKRLGERQEELDRIMHSDDSTNK